MRLTDEVAFPLRLVDEDGEIEFFEDIGDLQCNLEDYDSETDTESNLTDANGRPVLLRISTTFIKKLELANSGD